jgi:L-lactate dehydrogenase complex protein LldG
VRNAKALGAGVHVAADTAELLGYVEEIVQRHGVRRAVASHQPMAELVGEHLRRHDVVVEDANVASCAAADLGVTDAVAALATTGTVVQRSDIVGSRTASLLPRVHLCVVPAGVVVESTTNVLRPLTNGALPSNVVLITGPSRSADIEQILVVGVHGPVAIEIILVLETNP